MLPTCKQVAEQLSEEIDQPLTGFKKFKLKLHLLMCVYCRRYGEQLNISSKTIDLLAAKNKPNEELREKLLSHFRECHQHPEPRSDSNSDSDKSNPS
ncbi:MAG: zf-HC2 domain-containing protein [Kangiellaceae bacterium]|nr:zf-HC2 domain-containing protein [Kangiellaceae bacterium]